LAVQRSAAHVADAVYERILSAPVARDALFTAGGTGAGKTTAIRTSSQTKGLISEAAIVYDSNFNSLASVRAKVTLALEAGLISPNRACPASTEQVAEQFCAEMIQNLKRNVPESKHRSA
jgi:hypothetical protein